MSQRSLADVASSEEPQLRGHRELGAQLAALHHWQGAGATAESTAARPWPWPGCSPAGRAR